MARMWPVEIPTWVLQDRRRSSESKVFNTLKRSLDDNWSVYYSRPWYGLSITGGEIEGEADFILVHPDKGLFFLEVKGGLISYDPAQSKWHSVDRHGIKHKIKDPVEQAKKCRYEFAKKLEKQKGWPEHYINYKYGVILPDASDPKKEINSIGGHDKNLFCFAKTFNANLEAWLIGRLENHGRNDENVGPGIQGLAVIDSLIAQPVKLKMTMNADIRGDLEAMDQLLTGAQLQVIHSIRKLSRAVILGGAGTGKTLVAIEIAKMLADENKSVLVLTFNEPLQNFISSRLRETEKINVSGIQDVRELTRNGTKYDVVIVDEGQDFDWDIWSVIETLCEPIRGQLLVFVDSNQAIYKLPLDLSTILGAQTYELNLNLRNTRSIAKVTESLYEGPLIYAPGPNGKEPEVIESISLEDAIEQCIGRLKELINVEAVPQGDVAILCRDIRTRDKIQHALLKSGFLSTNAGERNYGVVCVETIPRFKGLESPIVMAICDSEWSNNSEMAYVSVSRARSRLFLVGITKGTLISRALSIS